MSLNYTVTADRVLVNDGDEHREFLPLEYIFRSLSLSLSRPPYLRRYNYNYKPYLGAAALFSLFYLFFLSPLKRHTYASETLSGFVDPVKITPSSVLNAPHYKYNRITLSRDSSV